MKSRESSTAVFPGSFDPPTAGHLDIIERGAGLFARLVVGVLSNPSKTPLLEARERVGLLENECRERSLPAVDIMVFDGLAIRFAESVGASWILRGLRSGLDLEEELPMALSNLGASGGRVETVFLPARPEYSHVRSRLVRELLSGGGTVTGLVPPAVERFLRERRSPLPGPSS